MKTIVISGSASLQEHLNNWCNFWQSKGYEVLAYPKPINKLDFNLVYPTVHKDFYKQLTKTNLHFIANETKGGGLKVILVRVSSLKSLFESV